jgi:hypothetical protein
MKLKTLIFSLALFGFVFGSYAQPICPKKEGKGKPAAAAAKGKKGPGPKGPEARKEMLEKYDTDKDGKLSEEERKAAFADRMSKKFDKDGDGELNDEEKAAMEEAREAHKAAMLKKLDKDGDGKISEEERKAARAEHGKGKGKKKGGDE